VGDARSKLGDARNKWGDATRVVVPAGYVREHVELGYASTVHGAQGDTTVSAHVLLGEQSTAASTYVGMTRGREANTVHLIAEDLDEAREQWCVAFERDRADLGPAAARQGVHRESAGYAPPRPLPDVIDDLRQAWELQADAENVLAQWRPVLEQALGAAPRVAAEQAAWNAYRDSCGQLEAARAALASAEHATTESAEQLAEQLHAAWETQRLAAHADARRIQQGSGLLGHGRRDIRVATDRLGHWADGWQPILGDLRQEPGGLVRFAARHPGNDHITARLRDYAHTQASAAAGGHTREHDAVAHAQQRRDDAHHAWQAHTRHHTGQGMRHGRRFTTPEDIAQLRQVIDTAEQHLDRAHQQLATLHTDPALAGQPDATSWLANQHAQWQGEKERHAFTEHLAGALAARRTHTERPSSGRRHEHDQLPPLHRDHGRGISR
jgi:exodeoxyribonuclease V alpha subunit